MIQDGMDRAEAYVRSLSSREKLYIILLAGAIGRSVFVFANNDATVYQMWLDYFLRFGELPYFDHPPLFFLVSGAFKTFFEAIRSMSPYLYWYLLFVPIAASYYKLRERSAWLFMLVAYVILYVWFVGYLGSGYEIASIASFLSGLAFIYLGFKIGELHDETTGLYAALFVAFAWGAVVYSNILLIDMFASTLMMAAYYLYYRFNREEASWRQVVLVAVVVATAFYSKYYALLLFPFIALDIVLVTRDIKAIARKSIPLVIALILFLPWAAYTDFAFLTHYASTHFLFLELPSVGAFGVFLWKILTPLFLGVFLYGTYKVWGEDRTFASYLVAPVVFGLVFHLFQAFVMHRSHSLINLSNYLLYILPLVVAAAAIGWRDLIGSHRYRTLLTVLVAFTLFWPAVSSSGIVDYTSTFDPPETGSGLDGENRRIMLEYDRNYTAPTISLNSLSKQDIERLTIPERSVPTTHFTYGFEQARQVWSRYDPRVSHFRWLDNRTIKLVAVEPVRYKLSLDEISPTNITVMRNGQEAGRFQLRNNREMYIEADRKTTTYRFLSDRDVPFVGMKTDCRVFPSACEEEAGVY